LGQWPFPTHSNMRHGARARAPMSGGVSHSQGPEDKPRGLWDGINLPEVMTPPSQWGQFPAELPEAPWYPSVHGRVVARDPAGVKGLIWAIEEDQGDSRYSSNKAAGQWEVWGWQVGHGVLPLPGVPRCTGWVRAGGGSTVKSKCSQKHSPASSSSNTMSLASPMHGPVELTASPVPLRLLPRGCRLQPNRAPVTSNDLCNSASLVLPYSGARSLCCSYQPENHPGLWPLPSGTCPRGTWHCRAVKPAPKQLLLPLLPTPPVRNHGQSHLSACHHSHPRSAARQPQTGGCSGQRGSPGSRPCLPRELPRAVTKR